MSNEIKFYSTTGPYGAFSNFSKHSLVLKDKVWPTSEHYFQAQKFPDTPHEEEIRAAPTAMMAARMGRERKRPLRSDWDAVKENIMREALLAKFTQHRSLAALLLETCNAQLIEHTKNDNYWGDGGDGSGLNRLGELLMEVRETLALKTEKNSALLFWTHIEVGVITDIRWLDFPWLTGDFAPSGLTSPLREVMDWLGAHVDNDDLPDPPFPDELLNGWAVVHADGKREEILMPPAVDWSNNTISWR